MTIFFQAFGIYLLVLLVAFCAWLGTDGVNLPTTRERWCGGFVGGVIGTVIAGVLVSVVLFVRWLVST